MTHYHQWTWSAAMIWKQSNAVTVDKEERHGTSTEVKPEKSPCPPSVAGCGVGHDRPIPSLDVSRLDTTNIFSPKILGSSWDANECSCVHFSSKLENEKKKWVIRCQKGGVTSGFLLQFWTVYNILVAPGSGGVRHSEIRISNRNSKRKSRKWGEFNLTINNNDSKQWII